MVTGAYAPEISSGGLQCQSMASQLAGRVEVHVLTTALDPALRRHDLVDGVAVSRVVVNPASGFSKLRAGCRMIVELFRLVPPADVVHIHGYSSKNVLVTFFAKLFRKPLVLSLHTAGFDEMQAVARQGSLALWAFLSADLYLSVSPSLVDSHLASGLPDTSIRLIPNGIDLTRFMATGDRAEIRAALELPESGPIIVFVGFFSHDKQPRVLFDAWCDLQARGRASTLVFVGATRSAYFEVDNEIAEQMTRDAEARGLRGSLVFTGATLDVPDYLRAADLFVLPSRREGLPVALLEAMACGLPCIASRLAGSTDTIIDDGDNGLLIPPGDVGALVAAIASLLDNPARAAAMGARARATVEARFASSAVADCWLAAYDHVLARHSPA